MNTPRPSCIYCKHQVRIVATAPLVVACEGAPPIEAIIDTHEVGWLVQAPTTCLAFIERAGVAVRLVWAANEHGRMEPAGYVEAGPEAAEAAVRAREATR